MSRASRFGTGVKKTIALFAVGFIIFILVFNFIGFGKIYYELLHLNLLYYSLAVVCVFLALVSWVARWRTFLKAEGFEISFFELFKNLLVGLAINNLTPIAKLGGEPVRAYILKRRDDVKMRKGFASVLAGLTMSFIVSTVIVIVSVLLIALTLEVPSWMLIVLVPFGLVWVVSLAGIVGIYAEMDIVTRIIRWFGEKSERLKPYQERILRRYKEFQMTFRRTLKNRVVFVKGLSFSFLIKFFDLLKYFFIFIALGSEVGLIKLLIALGTAALLLSLPATPGSLGIMEGGMISVFVLLGIPANISAAAVFLDRLLWFWGIIIIGGSLGTYYGVDILESQGSDDMERGEP